jgi:hypothetical protein
MKLFIKGYLPVFVCIVFCIPSCRKNTAPFKTTAQQNFNALWSEIDKNYGHFPVKNIDWDSVKIVYSSKIDIARNNDELFSVLSEMIAVLKDGHLILNKGTSKYEYNYYENSPVNFISVEAALTENLLYKNNNTCGYALFPNNIGYLLISNWAARQEDYTIIDTALVQLASTKGLIIDIRNNTGGNAVIADAIFAKFLTSPTITSYVRVRNGPGRYDFTDYTANTTVPLPGAKYSKPILLLTNKKCFSSNEYFIMAMKTLSNVKQFGGITGGGSANAIEKTLPNGWKIMIPTWLLYDKNRITYEGIGITPDSVVTITGLDITNRFDRIVATAREYLR